MNIGKKIKQLRYKAGLTQEQLAERLGISAQSVSKWENSITMPDITLLPSLTGALGITIDELFDLTTDQRLQRIEKRIDIEEEFPSDVFKEYEEFLKNQLEENKNKTKVLSLLAHLYHHRMESDARRVSKYAREAIMRNPEKKECQWLLQKAEGANIWDWNIANHATVIEFYKNVIENDNIEPATPLPYYEIMDNLIADHRTKEAREYFEIYKTLPAHRSFLIPVYEAQIALAEYDEKKADTIMENAMKDFSNHSGFLFEFAQYCARKCDYIKAIELYEKSWRVDENNRPRFTDPLHSIALIYEIIGDSQKAIETYDRMILAIKDEWGYSDTDAAVVEVKREKARLEKK